MVQRNEFTREQTAALEATLEKGVPYVVELGDSSHLEHLCQQAVGQSVKAHQALYGAKNEQKITFGKNEGETQYISWDEDGSPAFALLDATKPHTDVGIRGVNVANAELGTNKTTVIHTTNKVNRYVGLGELSLTVAMERLYNLAEYARRVAVEPYLRAVATINGVDPTDYRDHFFRTGMSWSSVARAIMYHSEASVSSANEKDDLLIKEHADQSGFTADLFTSSAGLQYRTKDGTWQPVCPSRGITMLPGAGEQHLTTPIDPIVHRVAKDDMSTMRTLELLDLQCRPVAHDHRIPRICRIALPFFISSQDPDAKVVKPHSPMTHPTYSARNFELEKVNS